MCPIYCKAFEKYKITKYYSNIVNLHFFYILYMCIILKKTL